MEPPTDRPFPHRPPLPPYPLLRLPVSSLSTQPHDFVHLHPQLFSPASLYFSALYSRERFGKTCCCLPCALCERGQRKKKKRKEKKGGARQGKDIAACIHHFQSSRGARDSIREINDRDRRIRTIFFERRAFPRAAPGRSEGETSLSLSRPPRERTERDTEILSRSGRGENCKENAGDIQRRPI